MMKPAVHGRRELKRRWQCIRLRPGMSRHYVLNGLMLQILKAKLRGGVGELDSLSDVDVRHLLRIAETLHEHGGHAGANLTEITLESGLVPRSEHVHQLRGIACG